MKPSTLANAFTLAVLGGATLLLHGCAEESQPPTGPGPAVASVEVTPEAVSLDAIGAEQDLTAIARDQESTAIGANFTWRSDAPAVATVSNAGLVEAVGNGSTTVVASTGGVADSATVTVQQVVGDMDVEPQTLTLAPMEMRQLTAEPQDRLGYAVDAAAITWESADPSVVEVAEDGTVSAVASGFTKITVTSDGFSAWAGVAVGPEVWESTGLGDGSISSLLILPGSGDLFAGTMGQGVLRSSDNGGRWVPVNTGLTESRHVLSLAATSTGDLFAATFSPERFFRGVASSFLFRSTDRGASWTEVTGDLVGSVRDVAVSPGDVVYLATSNGLYLSIDNGNTWVTTGFVEGVNQVVTNSAGDVFVRTDLELFRSTDGGGTWRDLSGDLLEDPGVQARYINGDRLFYAISIDPANDDIFACCPAGVFRSTDDGASWTRARDGIEHRPLRFAFDNGEVYAGTCDGGVYRSTDRGGTWQPVNAGLPNLRVSALTAGMGRLWVGTSGDGVLRSIEPRPATVGPQSPRQCEVD